MTTTTTPMAAINEAAYRQAWGRFWGMMEALGQIVRDDFPDGGATEIAPSRYQVDAVRDLAARVGALVEGYSEPRAPF